MTSGAHCDLPWAICDVSCEGTLRLAIAEDAIIVSGVNGLAVVSGSSQESPSPPQDGVGQAWLLGATRDMVAGADALVGRNRGRVNRRLRCRAQCWARYRA